MSEINVIWQSYREQTPSRHYWDTAMLEDIFSRKMWSPVCGHTFVHHDGFKNAPRDISGAVVIVPGRFMGPHIDQLNHDLSMLAWCVVMVVGDEESAFPAHLIVHPYMKLWIQTPKPDKHDFADRFLPVGYPTDAPKMLADLPFGTIRSHEWFFSGQVTHPRRVDCVTQLKRMHEGELFETPGFTQGLLRAEYYLLMASSKVAPCPSGPQTPDTFRLAEALEAGCVPIADGLAPNFPAGYWPYVFSEQPPFPIIEDWNTLPALVDQAVNAWPANANKISAWWQSYKRDLTYALEDDINFLSGKLLEPWSLGDKITVVIPTSPIPSHPDTSIIEEVITSIRYHLPNSEIILMMDGVRPAVEHRRIQYEEYKRRLLWKCNHDWQNVLPVVFPVNCQQAVMMRDVLNKYVKTPLVFFVEHDAPIRIDLPIEWDSITKLLESGDANQVRLYYFHDILPEHQYLMRETQEKFGARFVKTIQYSQWPNISTVAFYKKILQDHFHPDQRAMIETVMYSPVVEHPWDDFKVWIYYPPGDSQRFLHRNGRAGDPADW